ncbi:MAG: hypothetical protein Q4D05_04870 [Acinetobacter sp.]|nr:hypothetical protein [Acinetobacter sp.]
MTTFSYLILEQKSKTIEKDRFKNHKLVKIEQGKYIYARVFTSMMLDHQNRLNQHFFDFIHTLRQETQAPVYLIFKTLQHQQSVNDFSWQNEIQKHGNSLHNLNKLHAKCLILQDCLYQY